MKVLFNFPERDAKKILFGLLLVEISLITIYLVNIGLGQPFEAVTDWFNLDSEANIPAWFSSLQIFIIGLVFLIAIQPTVTEDPTRKTQNPSQLFLLLVSLGFIFLSMDEAASLHERITDVLRDVSWVPHLKDGFGIWMFLYLIIGVLLALGSLRQVLGMWRQDRRSTLLMMTGLTIVTIGAVVLETIGQQFLFVSEGSLLYTIEVAFEEFLEMSGMSLILYGSLIFTIQKQGESVS